MLECDLELHDFNKAVTQTSARALCRKMRLTYVNIKFYRLLIFRNVARVRNSCKLHGFLSVFGFLCIEMLHVYQSVELFMRLRRFFFLF